MSDARSALVTGGGRGLGFACARRLAENGLAVAILDRDESLAREAASSLPIAPDKRQALIADVRSRSELERAHAQMVNAIGAPTVVVNAAGVLRSTRFRDISDEEWHSVVDVSLTGTFIVSQVCLPAMIDAGWGRIVNFSSTAGKTVSTLGGAHYTAAKTAVLGLTRALAKEYAAHGITVNAVCPGLFDTEMARENCDSTQLEEIAASFPIPRLGEPEEVAAVVSFLASAEAGYITGAAFDVNGGDLMV